MKRISAAIISMMMLLSAFGEFGTLAADTTEYTYYTQVGASFIPDTDAAEEDVIWENSTAAVDTAVMGRRIINGTSTNGKSVKGIVNVGVKKYAAYMNAENMTAGAQIADKNDTNTALWRYAASVTTPYATYENSERISGVPNKALKYKVFAETTGTGDDRNPQLVYDLSDKGITGDFEITLRTRLDNCTLGYDYEYVFNIKDGTNTQTMVVKRTAGNTVTAKVKTAATVTPDAQWAWLKLIYTKENDTFSLYDLNNEGTLIDSVSPDKFDFGSLDSMQVKGSSKDGTNYPDTVVYVDDITVTDLSATDYIYYDNFESEYNYDFIQAEGTQALTVNETVKLVDKSGNDSGYSVPIYASAAADVSKLGKFSSTTELEGFDEPLNISWTVYTKTNAFSENFQGYEGSGIGSAPTFEPFSGDTTGKTVEYQDADNGEDSNKWLKYTSSTKDSNAMFWENEYIDGKVDLSITLRAEEAYTAGGDLAIPIMGNRQSDTDFTYNAGTDKNGNPTDKTCGGSSNIALIELHMDFDPNGAGGCIFFKDFANGYRTLSSGNHYILERGEVKADTDYQLTFSIDLDSDTFTYSLNGVKCEQVFNTQVDEAYLSQLRFCQTDSDLASPVTFYIDDVAVTKWLTLYEPVAQSMTVYKGDTVTLPETVPVILSDTKTRTDAPVTWEASIDSSNVQTQTIYGVVEGTDSRASLTATISEFPYEIQMPVLQYDNAEVFGLINGGKVTDLSVKKISNDTVPGKVYAAIFHEGAIKCVASAAIDTAAAWEKGDIADVPVTLNISLDESIDIDECTLYSYVFSENMVPLALTNELTNGAPEGNTPVIWMAGDSTAARYSDTQRPQTGWMEAFADTYAAALTVQNGTINGQGGVSGVGAIGGQSSKSYVDQGRLAKIIDNASEGDYLFIQFGHNDSHSETYRHTDPGSWSDETKTVWVPGTYEEYMEIFVTEARKAGLKPVILTNVVRATFVNGTFTGREKASLDRYAQGARYVAEKYHVPLVEVFEPTCDYIEEIGLEQSKQYYMYVNSCSASDEADCTNYIDHEYCANWNAKLAADGKSALEDSTHLNSKGAQWVAQIVYEGLCGLKLPLASLLSE